MGAPENILQQILRNREPSLLGRYRADPAGVRAEVEREARQARAQDIGAFFAQLFR
jgi:hypothetical protein